MSKLRAKSLLAASALSFLVYSSLGAQEQLPRVVPTISRETHSKLFDMLLPLDALSDAKNEFALVLRYSTSLESNSQIVILGREGKIHVTEYVTGGNLWQKGNEIFERTGRDDPSEIAKMIGVRKREFVVPLARLRRWRGRLLDGVARALRPKKSESPVPPKSESIILDGTVYHLWDTSKSGELHYSEYGSEVGKPIYTDESQFIRWMKTIRREVGARK
jgi:hypothetical protein